MTSGPSKVIRTERGWAGHFCCASRCMFRRNTLLQCGRRRLVVSTVGGFQLHDCAKGGLLERIGLNRYYETAVFHAVFDDPYWESNVERQIFDIESPTSLDYRDWTSSRDANDMHEQVVKEITQRMAEKK